jgi:hypothetical protein
MLATCYLLQATSYKLQTEVEVQAAAGGVGAWRSSRIRFEVEPA